MATAIGDLSVSLGMQNQQFLSALRTSGAGLDEFSGHAKAGGTAVTDLAVKTEEAGGHVAGAHRAFGFLGRELEHVGSALGGANSGLGSVVGGLGELTAGAGEAMHGMHALTTATQVMTVAQTALDAVTPLGWTVLATGALAAGAAYLTMSQHVDTAKEKAEKLKTVLGDLSDMKGPDFDTAAAAKSEELLHHVKEMQDGHIGAAVGMLAGPGGMALGDHIDVARMNAAQQAFDEFGQAVIKHNQDEAIGHTKTAIADLAKEAGKLDANPLRDFQDELAKTGKGADEITRLTEQFRTLTSQIQRAADQKKAFSSIDAEERKLADHGLSAGQQFYENFKQENPHATAGETAIAKGLGKREDEQTAADELRKKTADLKKEMAELTAGPMDKLIEQAQRIRQGQAAGVIGTNEAQTAIQAIQAKVRADFAPKGDEKAPDNKALEFNSPELYEAIARANDPQANAAQQTADNTAKMIDVLTKIAGKAQGGLPAL